MREIQGWQRAWFRCVRIALILPECGNWEKRSISWRRVYFKSGNQLESGRNFEETGFVARFDEVEGCLLPDVVPFPDVTLFRVHVNTERRRRDDGMPAEEARVSYDQLLDVLTQDVRI